MKLYEKDSQTTLSDMINFQSELSDIKIFYHFIFLYSDRYNDINLKEKVFDSFFEDLNKILFNKYHLLLEKLILYHLMNV